MESVALEKLEEQRKVVQQLGKYYSVTLKLEVQRKVTPVSVSVFQKTSVQAETLVLYSEVAVSAEVSLELGVDAVAMMVLLHNVVSQDLKTFLDLVVKAEVSLVPVFPLASEAEAEM